MTVQEKLPKTLTGWVKLASALLGIVVTLGSVAYAADSHFARAEKVEELEQQMVAGLESVIKRIDQGTCERWVDELSRYESIKADPNDELTATQRTRMIQLRNLINTKC